MFKKNTAVTGFTYGLVSATDGSAITTGTPVVYYTLDGGTQGTVAGASVHEGNGQWSVDLLAAEMNGDVVGLLATHASAINASFTIKTSTALITDLETDIAAVKAETALIVADTNELQTDWADGGRLDLIQDIIAVDTTTDIPAAIATAQADLDIITGVSGVNLLAATQASIDAIETDTSTTIPGAITTIDTNIDAILVDTGTTIPGTITTIDANVDLILADTAELQTNQGNWATATGFATPTNITAGTITTTTNLTNLPTIPTDWLSAAGLTAAAVDKIRDGLMPTQNATFSNIEFLWVAASDHVTPVTGASTTSVTRSIDGGAFGSATGTLAEVGNGIYQFDASAADMNGGIITFRFVATGGTPGAPDDAFITIVTGGGV